MAAIRKQFRKKIGKELIPISTKCKEDLCNMFLKTINQYISLVNEAAREWNNGESTADIISYLIKASEASGRIQGQYDVIKNLKLKGVLESFNIMYDNPELDRADRAFHKLQDMV